MAASNQRFKHVLRSFSRLPPHAIKPITSARYLQTTSQFVDSPPPTDAPLNTSRPQHELVSNQSESSKKRSIATEKYTPAHSPVYNLSRAPSRGTPVFGATGRPLQLTESLKTNLSLLLSQPPFFARISIHGKSYLVTAGDELRLPFLMHGVMPGDILRLDRVTQIGSREYTLVGGTQSSDSNTQKDESPSVEPIIGRTDGLDLVPESSKPSAPGDPTYGIEKRGPRAFLDDRLFVCRAIVLGTDAEPLRVEEKTKRRQRRVKHVKSKMRYTVLRITEIRPQSLEELEALDGAE